MTHSSPCSVRISTKKSYNHGLFIADFAAMPHGCSLWPAYWTVGPNWPSAGMFDACGCFFVSVSEHQLTGEVDVVEGVHEGPTNIYVLHSSPSCQIKKTFSSNEVTSNLINNVCTSSGKDNRGCGFSDPDEGSYGGKFNEGGGGVFAHLWDSSGFKIYRFARNAIPNDIQSRQPNPASWGTPAALFENSDGCDFSSHFFQHKIVLDTTICGDFAGPTYQGAGCPGTCQEAVANPANYKSKLRFSHSSLLRGLLSCRCEMENQLYCGVRQLEIAYTCSSFANLTVHIYHLYILFNLCYLHDLIVPNSATPACTSIVVSRRRYHDHERASPDFRQLYR